MLDEALGQRWLRFAEKEFIVSGIDVRFFLKGPALDQGQGNAVISRSALSPILGEPSFPDRMIAPKQVHGTKILDMSDIFNNNTFNNNICNIEADGILFDARKAAEFNLEASLRFADCAPILVAPSRNWVKRSGTPWVLMMHSGYKGTVLNIVNSGLKKVCNYYGTSALGEAWAWIGPCIGSKHYSRQKYGDEWTLRGINAFRKINLKNEKETETEKVFFDIAGELRLQLIDAGIPENRVLFSEIDTFENSNLCYSYRKGDHELRMFLWAG